MMSWSHFRDFENNLVVACCAPYPPSRAFRADPDGRREDDRLHWLTLALKRGERWHDGRGGVHEPSEFLANQTTFVLLDKDVLVPVPRSVATSDWPRPPARWPGLALALALRARRGTSCTVLPALRRVTSVAESSRAERGRRTTMQEHIASLALASGIPQWVGGGRRIVLIDDTLTQGTQLAACAEFLRARGYSGEVIGFAGAHVLDSAEEPRTFNIEVLVEWDSGDTYASRGMFPPRVGDRF